MKNFQKYIPGFSFGTVISATLLGILVMTSIQPKHTDAQPVLPKASAVSNKSNTTSSGGTVGTSNITVKNTFFDGKSVKILYVLGFSGAAWNNIDNLVSTGYDIKAIIAKQLPKGTAYFVILAKH